MKEIPLPEDIKAAFFDIDGTLVSFKTHAVPESTIRAIGLLKERGIKVIVATGRAITAIDHIKPLGFDGYITFNGACCVQTDGTVMFRKAIDPADIVSLLDHSLKTEVNFSLMYENAVVINDATPEIIGMHAHLNLPLPPLVDRKTVNVNGILQANIFISPEEEPAFMRQVMPDCVATRWTPLFADVNPKGVSKMLGVEVFCKYFNIGINQTIAFGDGGNDSEMLAGTGIGVAMGNASPAVKAVAGYVTGTAEDDGILKALVALHILAP